MENREKDHYELPCRAFHKSNSNFYGSYINEVPIRITKKDLPSNPAGYEIFDKTIEPKLKKKSVPDKVNIITFYGNSSLSLEELLSFKDVNLLSDFGQRYNDHFVSLPFTLRFRDKKFPTSKILEDIKQSFGDFVSQLKLSNLLGYVPAYGSFRELRNFVSLYLDNNVSIKSPEGKLNFVPLLIDLKNSSPDSSMRQLAELRQIKMEYLNEGYYLFYYGFSPRTPGVSEKKKINETLAKEFLLSYVGFDIIGSSYAMESTGGPQPNTPKMSAGIFDPLDFNYHLKAIKPGEHETIKPRNLKTQSDFFYGVTKQMKKDRDSPLNELKIRKNAFDYVESYK